jgi:hypothetical protein
MVWTESRRVTQLELSSATEDQPQADYIVIAFCGQVRTS